MKFYEIPRDKQEYIIGDILQIKRVSAIDYEYGLPNPHIEYGAHIQDSDILPFILDGCMRRTVLAVLDCLKTRVQSHWGIYIEYNPGEILVCKNPSGETSATIIYINLDIITNEIFNNFHPYAQGMPARIKAWGLTAAFFYIGFLEDALRL